MSIVLGIIIKDGAGNKDLIFASDGRLIEHKTKNIRNEDYDKIKRLGPKLCIGYAGNSRELFEDVYIGLKNKIRSKPATDLLFVASKLRATILETLKIPRHQEVERYYGPLLHHFIIGGFYNKKLRINTILSSKDYGIGKQDLDIIGNVAIEIIGSNQDIKNNMKEICQKRLGHEQSFDDVVLNLCNAISSVAGLTDEVNNHIFIRRISRGFELERYLGDERLG
jgi:hypothetical protein